MSNWFYIDVMGKFRKKNMRQIIFCCFIVLVTSCKSEKTRPEIEQLVQQLEKCNTLEFEHVGMDGHTTAQYKNYIKLREKATTKELLSLLKHKNSVVKGYASIALADRKYSKLHEIITPLLESGETVETQSADIIFDQELAEILYFRVLNKNNINKLSAKDSLFYSLQSQKLDSVIIFSNKSKGLLLEVALENSKVNPNLYPRIKELSLQKNKYAITALAKYKKREDIPLLIGLGENSLLAISYFPDKVFWNFLLKYKESNRSLDYFMAIASYRNINAEKLLSDIYSTCDSIAINSLDEALIKNYCGIYQSLILKIWENSKTIDLTGTLKLINDCPEKASLSFAKGLLNSKAYNFLELDSNYGTKDSIMPLMIETIAKYNKGSLLEICNKNIATAQYMELVSVLNLVKKNHIVKTKQNLLNRLTTKNYPFEIFQITETLLSFKDSNSNKKLVIILREKRNDWDRGNWSGAFRELLANNKLEIN